MDGSNGTMGFSVMQPKKTRLNESNIDSRYLVLSYKLIMQELCKLRYVRQIGNA